MKEEKDAPWATVPLDRVIAEISGRFRLPFQANLRTCRDPRASSFLPRDGRNRRSSPRLRPVSRSPFTGIKMKVGVPFSEKKETP
jgi:hypothetical protein